MISNWAVHKTAIDTSGGMNLLAGSTVPIRLDILIRAAAVSCNCAGRRRETLTSLQFRRPKLLSKKKQAAARLKAPVRETGKWRG